MKSLQPIEKKLIDSLFEEGKKIQAEQEMLSTGALLRLTRMRLFMTQRQLSKRAGVPQSTIVRIEKGEFLPNEKIIKKIFSAMGCDLFLIPVPRRDFDLILREKAKIIAEKRVSYLEGTMALEKQQPEKKWRESLLESEIEELLKAPSKLWNEDG